MVTNECDEAFELDPEQEKELLAAIVEAERGGFVSAHDLLNKISTI